jgi:uncharacterized protein (DUF2062 family)
MLPTTDRKTATNPPVYRPCPVRQVAAQSILTSVTESPASNLSVDLSHSARSNASPSAQAQASANPSLFQTRVVHPIVNLLRVGASPRQLAWSLAVGAAVGINPIIGSTTLLCLVVAFIFRLNLIASQIANHLLFPLQLALVVLYLRAGDALFHTKAPPLDTKELIHAMRIHPWATGHALWRWEWHAIIVWLLLSAIVVPILAHVLCPILTRVLHTIHRQPAHS